jgi:uncharacterized BrkB/YihY/UPF0761 family membrane protein
VGFFLLARVIYGAVDGALGPQLSPGSQQSLRNIMVVLGLRLPVPLHVISVGLLLQRRWLPPSWARITLGAVVVSGCWLGAALAIEYFASI